MPDLLKYLTSIMGLIKCIQVYEAISNPYSGHIILVSSLKDNFGKIKGEILYLLFLSFHHDLWGTIHIIFPQRRKLLSHRQAGKPPVYPVETGDFSDCQKYREEISEGAAVSNTREMLLAMSDFNGRMFLLHPLPTWSLLAHLNVCIPSLLQEEEKR